MKKILLLTDFSAASKHAISFAQALFDDIDVQFTVINAYMMEPDTFYSAGIVTETFRQKSEQQLKQLQELINQELVLPNHSFRYLPMSGTPVSAVDSLQSNEHFDLVVVGATGAGGSQWLGSTATGLIRRVETNVLVVPPKATIRPVEQIVLACDYKIKQIAVTLNPLKDLALRKGAKLTLLTIDDPEDDGDDVSELAQKTITQYFEPLKTDLYFIHDDEVVRGINTYLDTHSVDFLVTVPHQKGFFEGLFGQSVTRNLAFHPRVPLLSLYDVNPS